MKRELLCGVAIGVITLGLGIFNTFTEAKAETYTAQGTVKSVTPKYQMVTESIPTQSCSTVDVPVYGNGQTGSEVFGLDLEGAIIGGVIGNNVTKNVDNGGAIGALLGGMLNKQRKQGNSNNVVGYRQEQRCHTSYSTQSREVFSYNEVVVDAGGYRVTARTGRQVKVGDVVNVTVNLSVQ